MELLFKNETQFSEDMYTDFLVFHNKTFNLSYYLYTIGILLFLLFCIAAQISSKNYFLVTIYIVLFFTFLFWRCYHPVKTVKKEYESQKITRKQKITYLFFQKYFEIHFQGATQPFYYRNISKIFETEDAFYLYMDETHAFLIDKKTFLLR